MDSDLQWMNRNKSRAAGTGSLSPLTVHPLQSLILLLLHHPSPGQEFHGELPRLRELWADPSSRGSRRGCDPASHRPPGLPGPALLTRHRCPAPALPLSLFAASPQEHPEQAVSTCKWPHVTGIDWNFADLGLIPSSSIESLHFCAGFYIYGWFLPLSLSLPFMSLAIDQE